MAITDWPEDEKPREKLLSKGAECLSNAELLAIFLRTGSAGKTALDLARELLQTCQGLRGLFQSSFLEITKICGMGPAKYAQIQSLFELAKRYLGESLPERDLLESSFDTQRYLAAKLRDYPYEVFACLFLDSQHRIIAFEELFRGTVNCAQIYPREVVKRALERQASAVIFVHNHPSGDPQPSQEDFDITKVLQQALLSVEITVIDHIIVGSNHFFSFAETGW